MKLIAKFAKSLNNAAKDLFATYVVCDSYGTRILCWTYAEAHSWLAYCSGVAEIRETYDFGVLARRVVA